MPTRKDLKKKIGEKFSKMVIDGVHDTEAMIADKENNKAAENVPMIWFLSLNFWLLSAKLLSIKFELYTKIWWCLLKRYVWIRRNLSQKSESG